MGRSFESVRMGVKEVSARWTKAGRALPKEDQVYAERLAEMAKVHSSEAFYALDDPLEAAVFSVLIELMKARGICGHLLICLFVDPAKENLVGSASFIENRVTGYSLDFI